MKTDIRKDSEEIVSRLIARNQDFFTAIKEKKISLEDFAELIIIQYLAFNRGYVQLNKINSIVMETPVGEKLNL